MQIQWPDVRSKFWQNRENFEFSEIKAQIYLIGLDVGHGPVLKYIRIAGAKSIQIRKISHMLKISYLVVSALVKQANWEVSGSSPGILKFSTVNFVQQLSKISAESIVYNFK